ncbi:phosphotransferase enzyme family protein [Pseudarthrobacter sp. NS4]|uniref:phosphotransferase enzyme family protein n=1 Tax=Pseudarthrobacter sp. NS4 TaxID=2973976 RepID=UPI002163464C|nr:phosphotransferase [Pseudarthrobacter sp. NS4]
MLPLSHIANVRKTVDDEWRSPVADAVGERWGIPDGNLRFWRSSAAHVFVLPPGGDARGVLYARFAPTDRPSGWNLERGARLHARLSEAGAPVASLVRSPSGRAVERVKTPVGEMVACVLQRVDGEELDLDELDPDRATAWGTALAGFHQKAGDAAQEVLPPSDPFALLAGHEADGELAEAARVLGKVPRQEPAPLVVGHGDFELDDLRWHARKPTCFDLDESGVMPAAADVASAVRDLLGPRPGSPRHPELLSAFLDGYRRTTGHSISPEDLLLHRAAFAAQQLAQAPAVMDVELDGGGWLSGLAASLTRHYAEQRAIVLATADVMG